MDLHEPVNANSGPGYDGGNKLLGNTQLLIIYASLVSYIWIEDKHWTINK